jgi:hypothetical protein
MHMPLVDDRAAGGSSRGAPVLHILLSLCIWLLFVTAAHSQEVDTFDPRTGNAWTDRHLSDINAYAARYPQSFLDEIARYYGVSRAYAESLAKHPAWEPADVLMACALAKALEQPCRAVVREWSRDHSDGWAGVAKRMQDKPDAKQNRAIRAQIEASYVRWARPLVD